MLPFLTRVFIFVLIRGCLGIFDFLLIRFIRYIWKGKSDEAS